MEMEIRGNIDQWGCPVLECTVVDLAETKAHVVLGIIDTGSFHFGLKKSIIEKIGLIEINNQEINRPIVGTKINRIFIGKAQIGSGIFSDLTIMEIDDSFNYDFLIGSQFLLGKSFVIDGKNKFWSITW